MPGDTRKSRKDPKGRKNSELEKEDRPTRQSADSVTAQTDNSANPSASVSADSVTSSLSRSLDSSPPSSAAMTPDSSPRSSVTTASETTESESTEPESTEPESTETESTDVSDHELTMARAQKKPASAKKKRASGLAESAQKYVQTHFSRLTNRGAVGSFKKIVPISPKLAVAYLNTTEGESGKKDLRHECELLRILRANKFPALKIHGEMFEVQANKWGVIMDWIGNATLLDGKFPKQIHLLLPAILLGVKIDSNKESWGMQSDAHLGRILKEVNAITPEAFADIIQKAAVLEGEFRDLIGRMRSSSLAIADLQLLISPNGKLTIIDPLDVLRVIPDKTAKDQVRFVDVLDPHKKNSGAFIETLNETMAMLNGAKAFCGRVAKAKTQAELQSALTGFLPRVRPMHQGRAFGQSRISAHSKSLQTRRPSVQSQTSSPRKPGRKK